MITTTYNYSGASGFVFDASKIGFSGGAAVLLPGGSSGQTFTPALSGSIYDPTFFEVVGGTLRQKDNRQAGFQSYFAWTSQLNGNYGSTGLTVTPSNGAAINGGFLDLTGGVSKYASLSATGNFPQQTGTVAFQLKPAYSGTPGADQYFVTTGETPSSSHSAAALFHATADGGLNIIVISNAGSTILQGSLGTWSPVAGTTYQFVLQLDITNGATKVFIDGNQFGATHTETGARNALGFEFIGVNRLLGGNANFSINKYSAYSAIVAPANAFLNQSNVYNAGTVNLPTFIFGGVGHVAAWRSLVIVDTNAPGYTLNGKYWNGSAWVASDGSFAQSSSSAVVAANIGALPVTDSLATNAIFVASNTLQESVSSLTLTYTDQSFSTANPSIAPNAPLTLDQITVFTSVFTATGSDGVRFYLAVGSVKYYWNGSAWAVSDGSYAQTSLASDVNANAMSLPIALGVFFTPVALLHSADGTTTPSLTSLLITYDFFGSRPGGPNFCTVFGYVVDESGNVIPNANVAITNPTTFTNQGLIQAQGSITVKTDSIGYFSITLAETTTAAKRLTFAVTYPTGGGRPPVSTGFSFGRALVPNSPEANITDLAFVA